MAKNTLHHGTVRVIVYKEKKQWVGVALEFNIVETGNDPRDVMFSLDEAMRGYVTAAIKTKSDSSVLNQTPAKEYLNLWERLQANKPLPSSITVYNYGNQSLSFA